MDEESEFLPLVNTVMAFDLTVKHRVTGVKKDINIDLSMFYLQTFPGEMFAQYFTDEPAFDPKMPVVVLYCECSDGMTIGVGQYAHSLAGLIQKAIRHCAEDEEEHKRYINMSNAHMNEEDHKRYINMRNAHMN